MQFAPGDVFGGYTILATLGAGGMGEVYLARHPRLPRRDALKVLPADVSSDPIFRERFTREADLASGLWHPNIVSVYDRGEQAAQLWIAMEFVDGTDAGRQLVGTHPAGMPTADVIAIVSAVAAALDHAHHRGLLHRDVKPANIMLAHHDVGGDEDRRILLADFGIARPLNEISGLTSTNMTVGTMAYAAPEQLMGQDIDGRADQYGLAATAYHLLTGTQLFPQSNPAVVISHHLSAPPPTLTTRRPELAALDPVLARALAKRPADRYLRCADFARALSAAAADPAAAAAPTMFAPTTTPTAQPSRSHWRRPLVATAAIAVVGLLVAALAMWRPWDSPPAPSPTASPGITALSTPEQTPEQTSAVPSTTADTTAPTTTAAAPVDPSYAMPACYSRSQTVTPEPTSMNLFCREHFYEDLKWTKWTSSGADGSGIQQLQDCNPNCAQGEIFRNPVELHFTGSEVAPPQSNCPTGMRYYTQLIAAYPSGPAPSFDYGETITPTHYNGLPALRWNNLAPICLTY